MKNLNNKWHLKAMINSLCIKVSNILKINI